MCLGSTVEATAEEAISCFQQIRTTFPGLHGSWDVCCQTRDFFVLYFGEDWVRKTEGLLATYGLRFGMTLGEIEAIAGPRPVTTP